MRFIGLTVDVGHYDATAREWLRALFLDRFPTHVVSMEPNHNESVARNDIPANRYHLHAYFEDDVPGVTFQEFRAICTARLGNRRFHIDRVRNRRHWVRYITKNDLDALFHINHTSLSMNYQRWHWAKTTPVFSVPDPFVGANPQLERYHQRYHRSARTAVVPAFTGHHRLAEGYALPWFRRVHEWFVETCGEWRHKRPQLYLWGDSDRGKSFAVQRIIGTHNMRFCYFPGEGRFAFEDLDVIFHRYILFDGYTREKWQEHQENLKRLLEGCTFLIDRKCQPADRAVFRGHVILVSQELEVTNLGMLNRLLVIHADSSLSDASSCPSPILEKRRTAPIPPPARQSRTRAPSTPHPTRTSRPSPTDAVTS